MCMHFIIHFVAITNNHHIFFHLQINKRGRNILFDSPFNLHVTYNNNNERCKWIVRWKCKKKGERDRERGREAKHAFIFIIICSAAIEPLQWALLRVHLYCQTFLLASAFVWPSGKCSNAPNTHNLGAHFKITARAVSICEATIKESANEIKKKTKKPKPKILAS